MNKSTLGGSKKSCNTKFQNCQGKSEAVDEFILSSFLSLDFSDQPTQPFLSEYKMILASAFMFNSLWYLSSVFSCNQFILICPPFLVYFFGVLGSIDGTQRGCIKGKSIAGDCLKKKCPAETELLIVLTLSYTVLTDRKILILIAFMFSPHCAWCHCKCIRFD